MPWGGAVCCSCPEIFKRIHPVAFLLPSASQALDEVSTENYNCVDPQVLIYKK